MSLRITLYLLFFCLTLQAQEPIGTWQSRLFVPGYNQDVRLVMHFSRDSSSGDLVATMDVPDQQLKDLDMDAEARGDSLILDFSRFPGQFKGRLHADSLYYDGIYTMQGFRLSMKLVKGEADDLVYYRPQKPQRPYPYYEEEVSIKNKQAGLTLAGTFTRPKEPGKYPAVVFITGSGPEDRDETLFGHKPFLLLADALTRKGFAVLRCDDRGTGKSTGDFAGTSADYAGDVKAQLEYLEKRKDVDLKRIGLLGHSEGGLIAPLVAADEDDVAFLVLLAGPGMNLFDLLLMQDSLVLAAEGYSEPYIRDEMVKNKQLFDYVFHSPDSATAADSIDAFLLARRAPDYEIAQTLRQVDSRWMRYLATYDPAETLRKVRCPVLAVNGSRDIQVPAEENIARIREALEAGGNKNFHTEILPGLNHMFQRCKKCTITEYGLLDETFSPDALKVIEDWMVKTVLDGRQ
jgi:pimeloyl-ACP methyl ester carboxylesterase